MKIKKLMKKWQKFRVNLINWLVILQSKIIVAEKTTKTVQENISSSNSKITELERSIHKLEQYSRTECVEITGIPWDIPHVILEGVVIKLPNKIDVSLIKNDMVACDRLANSDRAIIKVLNRNHAEQIMNNKSKLNGMNFQIFRILAIT